MTSQPGWRPAVLVKTRGLDGDAQSCGPIKRGLGLLFKDFLHEWPGVAADEF